MPGKHKNHLSKRSNDRETGQCLTERERASILTPYSVAHLTGRRIARELSFAEPAIARYIKQGYFTPKKPIGIKTRLITQKRKRLVTHATQDAAYRRMPLPTIVDLKSIRASSRVLREVFSREGYKRRVALKKPFLTEKHITTRL